MHFSTAESMLRLVTLHLITIQCHQRLRVEDNVQDFDRRYGTSKRHNNYPLSSIVVLSACGLGVSPVILSAIDDEDNMGSLFVL